MKFMLNENIKKIPKYKLIFLKIFNKSHNVIWKYNKTYKLSDYQFKI